VEVVSAIPARGTTTWGRSSLGRALGWQSRGSQFDPDRLHQTRMTWPIKQQPKKFAMDLTVPQRTRGDRYWARITTEEWSIITQWRGTPQQIDQNCWSWYAREALAIEVQLIVK
jgi:hypothetical protein